MEQDVEVGSRKLLKGLERETGIEPATSSLEITSMLLSLLHLKDLRFSKTAHNLVKK
jgi:hypothetical protein